QVMIHRYSTDFYSLCDPGCARSSWRIGEVAYRPHHIPQSSAIQSADVATRTRSHCSVGGIVCCVAAADVPQFVGNVIAVRIRCRGLVDSDGEVVFSSVGCVKSWINGHTAAAEWNVIHNKHRHTPRT